MKLMKSIPVKPLTRHEAAEISGLSVRTIDRMVASGELPAYKFKRAVRIKREEFLKKLEAAEAVKSGSL